MLIMWAVCAHKLFHDAFCSFLSLCGRMKTPFATNSAPSPLLRRSSWTSTGNKNNYLKKKEKNLTMTQEFSFTDDKLIIIHFYYERPYLHKCINLIKMFHCTRLNYKFNAILVISLTCVDQFNMSMTKCYELYFGVLLNFIVPPPLSLGTTVILVRWWMG